MLPLLLSLTLFSSSLAQFDRSQCGSLKGCLYYPPGCTTNCKMYFSYVQEVDYLNMEIFGQMETTQQDVYYAVGFSTDAEMGDDMVVFCRYLPSSSPQVSVGLAYNGQQQRSNSIVNSQNAQLVNSTTVINGGIYCQFKQVLVPKVQGVRNLNDSYYILAATGGLNTDGSLAYHKNNRSVFPNKIDLRQYVKSGASVIVVPIQGTGVEPFSLNRSLKDWLKIIHAIFMTVSWAILLATGILFARHFKDHWPESTACGVKMWFAYHRSLNSMGLLLSILGVVAIFWSFDWTWMGPQPGWSMAENTSVGPMHCIFGALAIIIGCLQPFNAIFRCKPDSGARFLFNWIHRLIGILGFLCAMVAITLPAMGFNTMFYSLDAATALWFAYLAVLIATEIILEVLKIKKFCGNTSTSLVIPEKSDPSTSSAPVSGFSNAQSYVLLIFVLLSLVLITAFCVLIFLKPVRSG